MGSVLCCAAQSAACCACSSITSCCFSAAGSAGARFSKAMYLIMVVLSAILALVLREYGQDLEDACPDVASKFCLAVHVTGDAAVYRISLVLCLFFLVMLGVTAVAPRFHAGCWALKLALYIAAMVGSIFIPDSVFGNNGYAWFARVASVLFLVLQIVSMIDFAYNWNDSWVAKANAAEEAGNSGRKWLALIIGSAAATFLSSLVGLVLLFAFYSDTASTVFTTVTFIAIVAFTALQLQGPSNDGSLLSSSIVSLYCVYLTWSSITSNPNETGKLPFGTNKTGEPAGDSANMVLGMAVAGFSLAWTCYSGSLSFEGLFTQGKVSQSEETDGETSLLSTEQVSKATGTSGDGELQYQRNSSGTDAEQMEDGQTGTGEGRAKLEQKERYWVFHMFLATGSVYMAMLFTDWGSGDAGDGSSTVGASTQLGTSSMWIKIVSEWMTIGLYVWTLVAPHFCQGRDF